MDFDRELFMSRLYDVAGTKIHKRISEATGIIESQFSQWKNGGKGGSAMPTIEKLLIIAETYNCSIDYLLGLDSNNTTAAPSSMWDILFSLLVYDMDNDAKIDFRTRIKYKDSGPNIDETPPDFQLSIVTSDSAFYDLINEYTQIRNAFTLIPDKSMKVAMINTLIEKYKRQYSELPFKEL